MSNPAVPQTTDSTFTPPPQQNKIVYVYSTVFGSFTGNLWLANYDGSGAKQVNLPADIIVANGPPKVSPDYKKIFFSATPANTNLLNIYSCNMDGSNVKVVIPQTGRPPAMVATYYANGKNKILYDDIDNGGYCTANADGSDIQKIKIALPPNSSSLVSSIASLSPDAKTLFFELSVSNAHCIYSCNIDGSNVKPVVTDPTGYHYAVGPTFMLNGQAKLLYLKVYSGVTSVSIAAILSNLDGTGARTIIPGFPYSGSAEDRRPAISPDGKTLFFGGETVSAQEIFSCNIDGSNISSIAPPSNRVLGFVIGQAF